MRRFIVAAAAMLPLALASAQGTPTRPATPEVKPEGKAAPRLPAYHSPFEGYRPFSEAVAPKDWRRANDEVREAGGHIGLMKGQGAQPQGAGHGAHGAKAAPPTVERK